MSLNSLLAAIKSWFTPSSPQPKAEPFLFTTGGAWGDAINWLDTEKRHVYGFKFQKPEVGDVLTSPMENGRTGTFLFAAVESKSDPPDMFFAKMMDWGYTDTPEGKALIARCKTPAASLFDIVPEKLRVCTLFRGDDK